MRVRGKGEVIPKGEGAKEAASITPKEGAEAAITSVWKPQYNIKENGQLLGDSLCGAQAL